MSEHVAAGCDIELAVDALLDAEDSVRTIKPLTESQALSLDQAYRIQQSLINRKIALKPNDRWKGLKAGLTSKAKQRMVGINEPILGQLLYSNIIAGRQVFSKELIHPRVEPEIAVYFRSEIASAPGDQNHIFTNILAFPALEILDSRFHDYKFKIEDVVADNASTARVVLGDRFFEIDIDNLPRLGVSLFINGAVRETGTGAAVLGHPLTSALWTVRKWLSMGNTIPAGSILLTGGITTAVPISEGDTVIAKFEGWEDIHFYLG